MLDVLALGIMGLGGSAAFVAWRSHNRLAALDTRCTAAFADIDVLLKQRHDMLPNLVETVRGFASHERDVLTRVTEARAKALGTTQPEMRLEAETQLGQQIHSMLSVVERYPEIAASAHFDDLRNTLMDMENRISNARRFYNLTVAELDATAKQFPGALFANRMDLGVHKTFSLGRERALLDEPAAIRL